MQSPPTKDVKTNYYIKANLKRKYMIELQRKQCEMEEIEEEFKVKIDELKSQYLSFKNEYDEWLLGEGRDKRCDNKKSPTKDPKENKLKSFKNKKVSIK